MTEQEIEALVEKFLKQHDLETDRAGQEKRESELPITDATSTARTALQEARNAACLAEALKAILPKVLAEMLKTKNT